MGYVVNKNITHSGKSYPKGSPISEGDAGFKELLQAGHLNDGAEPKVAVPAEVMEGQGVEVDAENNKKKGRNR